MKTQVTHRKKHTGRNLVLLSASLSSNSLFKAIKKSSVRLAHFDDYMSRPENYIKAFSEGDGIYFEALHVAVTNFDVEDKINFLNRGIHQNSVLFTEPERYIYKIDANDYLKGYRDGINSLLDHLNQHEEKGLTDFIDDKDSSWGIKATGVLDSAFTGKGVNVAILDTGVFKDHIDMAGRKISTRKFVSHGLAGDVDGHGSHCAGVSCGYKDEKGMRYGVAHEANIFCGKVLDDKGEGTDGGILAGIEWAIKKKCKVISMSLGAPCEPGEPYSETYENVAKRAMDMGSLIVAAAGNESNRPLMTAPVGHPANCPSILAVGAVDNGLKIASFSCGGVNKKGGQVDIVAPGVSVYSMINKQHEHEKWDGTSMATPFVAGIAALYFEMNATASPLDIWSLLTQHARRLSLSSLDAGSGFVQAPVQTPLIK